MTNHWEPSISTPEPSCRHKDCGGIITMGEPHIVGGGGPDTDFCCSFWVCNKCGHELMECRAADRAQMEGYQG